MTQPPPAAYTAPAPRTAAAALAEVGTTVAALLPLAAAGDVEALHELRVATRRGRALLSQLDAATAPAQVDDLRRQLRWLARATAAARDADVLCALIEGVRRELAPRERRAMATVSADLETLRGARHQHTRAALLGARAAAVLTTLAALPPAAAAPDAGAASDRVTQAQAHDRCARTLRRLIADIDALASPRGAEAAAQADHALHALRLVVKRARYRMQWLRDVQPKAGGAKLLRQLTALQRELGTLQDAVVAERQLRQQAAGQPADDAVRLIAIGRALQALERRHDAALAQARARLPKVRRRAIRWLERPDQPVAIADEGRA